MKILLPCLIAACAFPFAVQAETVTDVGEATEKALEMQREGRGAVPNRPMLEEAAERSYARYLESFTYPIPKLFEERQSFSPE